MTFVLSPDGQIAFRHLGLAAWDGEKTVNFLKALARNGRQDVDGGLDQDATTSRTQP